MKFFPSLLPTLLLILCTATATPATADWLVLHNGARIETRGPWEVRSRLIVFETDARGLSSTRLSEVDLEASRQLSEDPPAVPRVEPLRSPPRSVLTLTNADLPSMARREPAPAPAGSLVEERLLGEIRLEVESWQEIPTQEIRGAQIVGVVRNPGSRFATGIHVQVRLYDPHGRELAAAGAFLPTPVLPAGGSTEFRAFFPGTAKIPGDKIVKIQARGFEPAVVESAGLGR